MLTKKGLETIKYLNPAYRFAFGVTIFVMIISAVILAQNGQAAQRTDSLLFMSFYALVNFYLYFMAYLYQPVSFVFATAGPGSSTGPKVKIEMNNMSGHSDREREH